MNVYDVVMNSVWYDPRVRKQLTEYMRQGIDVECVGLEYSRYDEEKIKHIPCKTIIEKVEDKLRGKLNGALAKIKRENYKRDKVAEAIISCNPDVINANDLNALIRANKTSKKLKCRLVYDLYEIWVENLWGDDISFQQKLFTRVLKSIEGYIVKRVDLMICISKAASDYFAKEYDIKPHMVITNCSLYRESFTGTVVKHEGFKILNHGKLYEGRGYDLMVKATKILKDSPNIKMAIRGLDKL